MSQPSGPGPSNPPPPPGPGRDEFTIHKPEEVASVSEGWPVATSSSSCPTAESDTRLDTGRPHDSCPAVVVRIAEAPGRADAGVSGTEGFAPRYPSVPLTSLSIAARQRGAW